MLLKKYFVDFIGLLMILTFAFSIGIPKGYHLGTIFLFLSSFALFFLKPKWAELEKDDKRLFYAFLSFGLSMFVFVYLDDFRVRDLDRPSRFILVLPVLILLLQVKIRQMWLWYGVVIGAILGFVLAFYERQILGYNRAEGGEYPIMFGDTGMMLGMLSFVASVFFLSNKRYFWLTFSLIGGLCGIGASVLSETRGGWVALPLLGFFLFWQSRFLLKKSTWVVMAIVSVLLVSTAVLVPQTGVKNRINQAISDISQYESGGNKNTSVGLRFEMWKAAFYMFEDYPILGAGKHSSIVDQRRYIDEGLLDPAVYNFGHAHNEYFNALGFRGVVGLVFLLIVYLVPLRIFLKKVRQYNDNWNIKAYAMAGALVPMSYMDFSLSQVMFAHNIGVMMYVFPIVYFWAAVRWAEREGKPMPLT